MKRHLLILAPVLVFVAFVGCGGGDDAPPAPPFSSNKQTTPEILCAVAHLDRAFSGCQSQLTGILPLLLQAPQSGGGNNLALLTAAFNRPHTIDPILPIQAGGNQACLQPGGNSNVTCKDDMNGAMLLLISALKKDKTPAINDPWYQNALYLHFKGKFILAAQQLQLTPQQRLLMAGPLQQVFSNSSLPSVLGSGSTGILNSYFGANNTVAYTPAATPSNSSVSLGLGFNSNGARDSRPVGQSLGLHLNTARAANSSGISVTTEDTTKVPSRQLAGYSELSKARGVGLPTSTIRSRNP